MVTLDVTGMTCGGCAKAVTRAIVARDAGAVVEIALGEGRVTATTTLTPDEAAAAVSEAGYAARPVTAR